MADDYSSFQSLLEENAVTVLAADAELQTGSGVRIEVKKFEQGLRADPRDYQAIDLPAIAVMVEGTDGDEDESIDTVQEEAILGIFVIVRHADFKTRRTLAMDIAARAKRVARAQTGSGAWNNIQTSIPGAKPGADLETEVSGPTVDDLGQDEARSTSQLAVGSVVARVVASIDDDVS